MYCFAYKYGCMADGKEISYGDLRRKDVVNYKDGRKLGRVCDVIFAPESGCLKGIIAPSSNAVSVFRRQEVYIPYCNIKTIGKDVILVDISGDVEAGYVDVGNSDRCRCENHSRPEPEPPKNDSCDHKCDKCMLFDCLDRWKISGGGEVYIDGQGRVK